MSVVNLNPFNENDLEDKRNEIAENCFLELDIVIKSYNKQFGEDYILNGLSLLHSSLSYLLVTHTKDHKLSNIDIDKFVIPYELFKDSDGKNINDLSKITDNERLHFYTNLVINSKKGIEELTRSSYFHNENYVVDNLFMPLEKLIGNIFLQYDNVLLLLNNKYNKLILNFI